jgi:hypothetical protein
VPPFALKHGDPDENGCIDHGYIGDASGYMNTSYKGRRLRGHQIVLAELGISVPAGSVIHHVCENRRCINPEHLQVLTHAEHQRLHNTKTHCLRGHAYAEHGYTRPSGKRYCGLCRRLYRKDVKRNARADLR